MKIVKRILKFIFILIGVLFITALLLLGIDKYNTTYLTIDKNKPEFNNSFLIRNANIIPMNQDTVLMNKMILIEDGIIQKIADSITAKEVEIINAKNKFLMPGLIDMHVHVWDKYELGLYLANGVTAIRNVWGIPMHLRIRKEINDDEILAPLFFTTGPKLTGPEFIGDDNLQLFTPEEAKNKVHTYKEKQYDFIKTYYGLPEDIFDAIIEQARISDMDIVAHPSQKVPYSYHFNPQIKSIEHAEDIVQQPLEYKLDTIKLKEVVDRFSKSNQTSFCPTLTVYNNIYQMLINDNILASRQLELMNPLIKEVDSRAQFERWQNTKTENTYIVKTIKDQHNFHLLIIKKLHDSGVTIICGTDAGIGITVPGISLHKELKFYKQSGLSNYEVLRTATVNAANTHKIMNNMGTVEVGKLANLILVEQNPLLNLSVLQNPELVFVKGRILDRKTLKTFEKKARNRKNFVSTSLRYFENEILEK